MPRRKKTCAAIVQKLLEADYHGGKVRIHHAENPEAAGALRRFSCAGTFLKQTLRSVPAVVFAATMPSAAA
ncbi:MAG: hypothetical protein ACLRSD_04080 [Oscillibacter sp.]